MKLPAILLLLCSLMLAGCPQKTDAGAEVAPEPVAAEPAPVASAPAKEVDAAPIPLPGEVDYRCQSDADCAVKNVGNCCGYFPACVNKDSATFPEQVKAQCEAEGRMSVCGFQEISGCRCVDGRCAARPGDALEARPVQ